MFVLFIRSNKNLTRILCRCTLEVLNRATDILPRRCACRQPKFLVSDFGEFDSPAGSVQPSQVMYHSDAPAEKRNVIELFFNAIKSKKERDMMHCIK